jgi:hypothetical protein
MSDDLCERHVWLMLWVGELSVHCKKDLPGSTELSGEGKGRPGQHNSRGGEMNILNKKNYFLYSTSVKSMSQSKGSSTNTVACLLLKVIIFVRGCHYGDSSRAARNLATSLKCVAGGPHGL